MRGKIENYYRVVRARKMALCPFLWLIVFLPIFGPSLSLNITFSWFPFLLFHSSHTYSSTLIYSIRYRLWFFSLLGKLTNILFYMVYNYMKILETCLIFINISLWVLLSGQHHIYKAKRDHRKGYWGIIPQMETPLHNCISCVPLKNSHLV